MKVSTGHLILAHGPRVECPETVALAVPLVNVEAASSAVLNGPEDGYPDDDSREQSYD